MAGDLIITPAFILVFGAVLLPAIPRSLRSITFLVFPLVALIVIWTLPDGVSISAKFMQYALVLCKVDQLSRVFATIFAIIALAGEIYSFHVRGTAQHSSALLYGGSAIGVVLAGDFITLLIFWEVMAVSATYLVWARRNRDSERAGMRYLLVHLFGGSLLLAGIVLHIADTGSTEIVQLTGDSTVASWLILGGVALNAAIPPLHAWLADAYPRASVTGAVFLSALTTKSAVYVLARMFPGLEFLVFLGVMMALYGVVFAVLANDIREILAYHIISQVGYMVAGVGIGTEMALNGTVAHAVCHILYKALLFMGAGVVLHSTGRSKLTELGGLARAMPITLSLYMVGAFSISGFPFFNGFVSKSMVVSAAGAAHWDIAMLLLTLASVGTFLHTGLKLPYFTWFAADRGITPERPPANMHLGMAIVAFLCILLGIAPSLLYQHLPYHVSYEPYTPYHLIETAQILLFTFVAFWFFRAKLAGEPTITLDTDWFYRRPAGYLRATVVDGVGAFFDLAEDIGLMIAGWVARLSRNPARIIVRKQAREEFDPDHYRPSIQTLISVILISVVSISLLGLYWLFN